MYNHFIFLKKVKGEIESLKNLFSIGDGVRELT
ncbi:hypothetical protein CLTHE_09920 [Clostridium thermobutyricum DSM 4928]|uniref:Uncharacterized protein n=1 Tax=Clostridium thermobutyricum DSM 4928 TaxID=1121339 RepID=A0A1V4SWK2_9CLOT|nr:hypothetical protein CLTHE_09920 [Clostridium thermobutyricum DSM 4928]